MPKKPVTKSETKTNAEANTSAAPSSFKTLVKLIANGEKPRGLKVVANDDGGYTFNYGSKKAPVAVIASKDEVAMFGIFSLGLRLP